MTGEPIRAERGETIECVAWRRCVLCQKPGDATDDRGRFLCADCMFDEECRKDIENRLLDKCIPEPNSGCWLWVGALGNWRGYGHFWNGKKVAPAHRVSYELFVGPIPDGLVVMHKCDVPACINPDHLTVGTLNDNMQDCIAKGRMRRGRFPGEKAPFARLTEAQVAEIRRTYPHGALGARKAFAKQYGVATSTIAKVVAGDTWQHSEGAPIRTPGRNFFKDRTSCQRGHPYDAENTRWNAAGKRECRACDRLRWRKRQHGTGREPADVVSRREYRQSVDALNHITDREIDDNAARHAIEGEEKESES